MSRADVRLDGEFIFHGDFNLSLALALFEYPADSAVCQLVS